MGNQGMTNWKFTAFFAIALMLAAGLFSSTAMAADNDGLGATTVELGSVTEQEFSVYNTDPDTGTGGTDTQLAGGSTGNALQFTYTITDLDMASGEFQIEIPSGWTVSRKSIIIADGTSVSDTTKIYETKADAALDTDMGTATSRGRVTVTPATRDYVRTVKVALDGGWSSGGTLIIIFGDVTDPNPSSLNEGAGAESYRRYRFPSSSKAKDGRITELKETDTNDSGEIDDEDINPHAFVNVGNAREGSGTVEISPAAAYETEKRSFVIAFTAAGPMYGSKIQVTIPSALLPDTDPETIVSNHLHDNLVVTQRYGVDFGTPDEGDRKSYHWDANDSRVVTIYIDDMHEGDIVRISYPGATVGTVTDASDFVAANSGIPFVVQAETTGDEAYAPVDGVGFVVDKPDNGVVYPLAGSGMVEITSTKTKSSSVQVGSIHDLSIKYTSATKVDDVYLWVVVPDDVLKQPDSDGDLEALVLTLDQYAGTTTRDENFGYVPDTGVDPLIVGDDDDAVVWGPIDFSRAGRTFTARIDNVEITGTPGIYDWTVYLAKGLVVDEDADPRVPVEGTLPGQMPADSVSPLYVLQTSADLDVPDVTFKIKRTAKAGDETDDDDLLGLNDDESVLSDFAAGSKYTIEFEFEVVTGTPIKDGEVSFEIPALWDDPVETEKTDVAGRVTATFNTDGDSDDTEVDKDDLTVSSSGEITVEIPELLSGGTVTIIYGANAGMRPAVQYTAEDDIEIIGYYKVGAGKSFPKRNTGVSVFVNVTNAESGSGSATISVAGSNHTIRAGSEDNRITVIFTAAGTMDGGRVRFSLPDSGWGPMQSTAFR